MPTSAAFTSVFHIWLRSSSRLLVDWPHRQVGTGVEDQHVGLLIRDDAVHQSRVGCIADDRGRTDARGGSELLPGPTAAGFGSKASPINRPSSG
jgi:hypothetical protein